jgi:hypothetical protein
MVNFRSLSSSTFVPTVLLPSLFLLLGLLAMPINAQNATWNGGTGNWSDASNWNPGAVPNSSGDTITYNVTISVPGSVVTMDVLNDTIISLSLGVTDTLSINSSASLGLWNGASNAGTLINNGSLLNGPAGNGGTIDNTGTLINMGTLNNVGGTINSTSLAATSAIQARSLTPAA